MATYPASATPEISKSADQVLLLLLEVSRHGPLTTSGLARAVGLNRSLVNRLMQTLHQRGFVMRADAGYIVSPLLMELGGRVLPHVRATSDAVLRGLAGDVEETVALQVPDGLDAVVAQRTIAHQHLVRVEPTLGLRRPLTNGAGGLAMLAFLDASGSPRSSSTRPTPTGSSTGCATSAARAWPSRATSTARASMPWRSRSSGPMAWPSHRSASSSHRRGPWTERSAHHA